jgi:hypothetical protein
MLLEKTRLIEKLDKLRPIDWSNFNEASRVTRSLLQELVEDKETLRILVAQIEHDPHLLGQCERHELLERLDIYDARDRGFQLRFNFTTPIHSVRPHDHRYSFSTYILRGSYQHIWFDPGQEIYDRSAEDIAIRHLDKTNPDENAQIDFPAMKPLFITTERSGAQYTIHHSCVHATVTTPDSLSLIVKGPGEKNRSLIADRATAKVWWRFGREQEAQERVQRKRMPVDYYKTLRRKLADWGITQ